MLSLFGFLVCKKGMMAGHWFDLQASWAAAAGLDPATTCKQAVGASGGISQGFLMLAVLWHRPLLAGVESWKTAGYCLIIRFVLPFRWVGAPQSFVSPVSFAVLWPAAWVSAVDKTRSSKSDGGRHIWEVYDENAWRLFILVSGKKFALLSWLVMSPWLGMFGLSPLRYRWFVPFSLLEGLHLLLVYGLVVALLSSRWWLLEALLLEKLRYDISGSNDGSVGSSVQ